jgi:hypothetical protein
MNNSTLSLTKLAISEMPDTYWTVVTITTIKPLSKKQLSLLPYASWDRLEIKPTEPKNKNKCEKEGQQKTKQKKSTIS